MEPLADLLGSSSSVATLFDAVETTLSSTAQEVEKILVGEQDGAMAVTLAEMIRHEALPQLSTALEDLLGTTLPAWSLAQLEQLHDTHALAESLSNLRCQIERGTRGVLEIRRQLGVLQASATDSSDLMLMLQDVHEMLAMVVRRSTLFTSPPPQVLKTTNKFNCTVCCLAGNALQLDIGVFPTVRLAVLSEAQAQEVHAAEQSGANDAIVAASVTGRASCGQLANSSADLTFDQTTESTAAKFRSMCLRSVKRSAVKTDTAVTEEKFCLVARISIPVNSGLVEVATLSPPIVVIVHGMQQNNARATILWDAAGAGTGPRTPFEVPDILPWSTVAELLMRAFQTSAGTTLSSDQIDAVGAKLGVGSDGAVPWQHFNKLSLPGRNFTFWEWFCGVMDLTQKYLADAWSVGAVAGFVSKEQVQTVLSRCSPGTFLLRFSDSVIGGVTVSWVSHDGLGQPQVRHLQPWLSRDFGIRSLADRLNDLEQLRHLYPEIPKAAAFPPSTQSISDDGSYVACALSTVIAGAPVPAETRELPTDIVAATMTNEDLFQSLHINTESIVNAPSLSELPPLTTSPSDESIFDELLRDLPDSLSEDFDVGVIQERPNCASQDLSIVDCFPLRSQRDIF